jgi:myosin heavy chain 6/7
LTRSYCNYQINKAAGKKAKSGSGNTISAGHREQLNKLMNTLKATHPHFVRCIIPNEIKTGGVLDAHLVLHQLHCNGVLEGIRICRKGFPSRVPFADFVQRYSILAPAGVKANKENPKKGAAEILKESGLSDELYRIGLTKVLVKAGVLGTLEEQRDIAVSKILVMLQSYMRLYIMKKEFKKLLVQKVALSTLQRNLKAYIGLRNWPWWKLFTKMKPLLGAAKRAEEEAKRKAEEEAAAAAEAKRIAEEAKKREEMLKNIEATLLKVEEEKKALSEERDKLAEKSEKLERYYYSIRNLKSSFKIHKN